MALLLQPASTSASRPFTPGASRFVQAAALTIHYVDADATGAGDGSSWADAFTELQPALEAAGSGDQVWVGRGIYKPTDRFDPVDPRSASFQMKNGVAIYGGFDPTFGETAWEDRDWASNPTILSGDLGTVGDVSDNSYHVFYHPDGLVLDSSAVLAGFTITGGNANSTSFPHNAGGGMYNNNSSPTLTEVRFTTNSAYLGGGMVNHWSSNPVLTNAIFSGNSASYGGGTYTYNSNPTLTNITFSANSAIEDGGGMYNASSNPTLTNVILWGNTPNQIINYNSTPVFTYSDIQGGYAGTGNIDLDPQFIRVPSPGADGTWGTPDDDYGDLRLQPTSPAIDAGDNTAVPIGITTDLSGVARFVDIPAIPDTGIGPPPVVDMGAYEVQVNIFLPLLLK